MKRIFTAAASVALAFICSTNASARDLTVVGWGGTFQDALREIYFQPFSAHSGHKVLEESWEGGIGVLAAKVQAGAPNWDAVQVEAEELELGCEDGLFEPIEWDRIGVKAQLLPEAVHPCGVGAFVWSTGIAYDADRLSAPPKNLQDFWNIEQFPGKRGFRRGPKYTLEFALIADGVAPSKVYEVLSTPQGVDRAFAKLNEIKPAIIWWDSGAQPLQLLASGEVAMAISYNGRIPDMNRNENKKLTFVWPGSIYSIDSWVVLKGSTNREAAMDFIGFASRAENQVKLPSYISYGITNVDAIPSIAPDLLADLPTAPQNIPEALQLDTTFWVDNVEVLNKRFNAWLATK